MGKFVAIFLIESRARRDGQIIFAQEFARRVTGKSGTKCRQEKTTNN
jgi:hypothetical protein